MTRLRTVYLTADEDNPLGVYDATGTPYAAVTTLELADREGDLTPKAVLHWDTSGDDGEAEGIVFALDDPRCPSWVVDWARRVGMLA